MPDGSSSVIYELPLTAFRVGGMELRVAHSHLAKRDGSFPSFSVS